MKKPYLVQRGTMNKVESFEGIDSLVRFDYMGSAEFEYGALPKALKLIVESLPKLNFHATDIISQGVVVQGKKKSVSASNGKNLWLLCQTEDELPLKEFFGLVAANKFDTKVHTKELLYFGDKFGEDSTDFWWDLEQGWIATFGQKEIENVRLALDLVKKKKGW